MDPKVATHHVARLRKTFFLLSLSRSRSESDERARRKTQRVVSVAGVHGTKDFEESDSSHEVVRRIYRLQLDLWNTQRMLPLQTLQSQSSCGRNCGLFVAKQGGGGAFLYIGLCLGISLRCYPFSNAQMRWSSHQCVFTSCSLHRGIPPIASAGGLKYNSTWISLVSFSAEGALPLL